MNTFWLKTAVVVIVILGGVFLVNSLLSPKEDKQEKPTKTFYDVAQEDKERLLGQPKPEDFAEEVPQSPEQTKLDEVKPEEPAKTAEEPQKPAEPLTLYFKEIPDLETIDAERLINVAVPARSIGRLQVGFNLMVQNCRQIMERWPGSIYDYKARRLLREMPERYQSQYKITQDELDLIRFTIPKPGTKPFILEEND